MVITLPGYASTHDAASRGEQIASLRSRLAGRLVMAGDAGYDELRQVQDVTLDRRPLGIVHAANADDVALAVRYARDHGLALAVRSGGHSMAGHSMVDGGIVVDLSGLKRVSIDPLLRTARVQAGATSGDLAGPAHDFGLALSTGDTSSVGMGGLVTGGGIGFMVRKYGLAIDNLLAARVVTANGDIVTASEDDHPDLFWAIRGGGGNVGVVTELELRLAPVGHVLGGVLILPASREVLRGYLEYTVDAPDGLTTLANLMHVPPAPFVPEERVGELVLAIHPCWAGRFGAGERALAPLRALAAPIADAVSLIPYPRIYDFTAHQAVRHGWSMRSTFAHALSDAAIDASLAAMERATSPYSIVHFRGLGGAYARVGNEETAFAHRDKRYLFAAIGVWLDPTEDATPHRAWTEALWQQVRSEGDGVYVNFLADDGPRRIREAYPEATYARLAEVKRTYDPHNLFKRNQNVPPAPRAL